MKQRLADYVADFLVAHGVTDVFSVVNEAGRADEMRKRSERAEAVLKRIIEIVDTAQREGYTPETLEAAIDEALNAAREILGGQNNEQPLRDQQRLFNRS